MVEFLEGLFADPRELVGKQGLIQLVLLIAAYGYGLARASKNISRGTELLLSIPEYSGLIGSVVLPVLGAVPDGAFILFSGLGPHAQDELSVGVGALAGSTVLLLTVTWGLSIIYGRVDLNKEGRGNYKVEPRLKNDGNWSMKGTGINCLPAVKNTARLMMLTSLSYFIIQGPAFAEDCGRGTTCERKGEQHWWAFAGVLVCMLGFTVYLVYQMRVQDRIKYQQFEGDENPDTEDPSSEIEMTNLAPEHITPEAAASMTPVQQTQFLKRKAFTAIFLGLGLIMVLTDPMVDALAEFSKRIDIPPFFVAFVLAPLASSSLEIVSACEYASKKTVKTSTISLTSILGAACMNNTFGLAIFLVLVFVQNLAWEFAAETLSIVFVQQAVGLLAQRSTFRLLDAALFLSLYPLAIGLVVGLEWWGLN